MSQFGVCEERPAAEHGMSTEHEVVHGSVPGYQLAEIRWSGCGPYLVSQ